MKPFKVREYRGPSWIIGLYAISLILSAFSAWQLYAQHSLSALSIAAMLLVPLLLAGLIDALTTSVVVTESLLSVRSNFRRRIYAKSLFSSVSWSKGGPVALKYSDGGWLKLPSVNTSSQDIINTLRAWLKRPEA